MTRGSRHDAESLRGPPTGVLKGVLRGARGGAGSRIRDPFGVDLPSCLPPLDTGGPLTESPDGDWVDRGGRKCHIAAGRSIPGALYITVPMGPGTSLRVGGIPRWPCLPWGALDTGEMSHRVPLGPIWASEDPGDHGGENTGFYSTGPVPTDKIASGRRNVPTPRRRPRAPREVGLARKAAIREDGLAARPPRGSGSVSFFA
mmetsp:Transcript_24872/g.85874  ORF Transcript_24872/g.85874 Transcript_24872/m.85874 type:complete len:202 (-) Transcript_24872:45-650(-)